VIVAHVFSYHGSVLRLGQTLSLECHGLDLVCSISSLFSSFSTVWLMNSLPLSEWKIANAKWELCQHRFQHRNQVPQKRRICSRLKFSPACMLTINSQHAGPFFEAHLV
jgi:hypothetical protein